MPFYMILCVFYFLLFGVSSAYATIETRLETCLERIESESKTIREILKAHNVPDDFIFLICAESTGDARVCSEKGACGLWQLMPATARRFGLIVNRSKDERLETEKATKAAALYIRELLNAFNDDALWTVAAFNVGGHNLKKSIQYEKGLKVRIIREYYPQAYNLVYTFQKMRELAKGGRDV